MIQNIKTIDREMKFKETRTMSETALRRVCAKNHWYTHGTPDEFGKLCDRLTDCCGYPENLTTEKLVEIGTDIWEHSEITAYTFETVLFELARNCTAHFDLEH